MKTKPNVTDRIAAVLERGHTITPMQALERFGCYRLGARIHDLRGTGMNIETQTLKLPSGKWVAKYKLAKP